MNLNIILIKYPQCLESRAKLSAILRDLYPSERREINIVLDILYSCLFSLNYQANLDYKFKIAQEIETNRIIDNEIISETPKED